MLQDYQNALQLMQQGKYEKARVLFEKLGRDASPEILERCRVYLTVCERNVQEASLTFKTTDEQYDYAVSLLNSGSYEEARDQFEAILTKAPEADLRALRHGPAKQHDRAGRRGARASQPRHPDQSLQPHPGPLRSRLHRHGRRSPVHRAPLSREQLAGRTRTAAGWAAADRFSVAGLG